MIHFVVLVLEHTKVAVLN